MTAPEGQTFRERFQNARWTHWLPSVFVFLILLAIAFRQAWRATHDLEWPYDFDLFRDAAFARVIVDGHFPADAYYAGEQNWYNPLGPALIGVIARLFALEPIRVYAHHGAWIGLAVPLAIFVLAVVLFGRWGGLASIFAFLFLGPNNVQPWTAPSYSPWLFTNLLSLIPFAFTVGLAIHARACSQRRLWAVCGVFLGLTFLVHTSSAVLAGFIALVLAWERRQVRSAAIRVALVLVPAIIISTPLLATILGHYGLQIRNSAPQDFIWIETDAKELSEQLKATLNFGNALALGGFVMLWRNRAMTTARCVMTTWVLVCVVMLAYGYARQFWPSANLPGLVPPFHWLFHLRLAKALLLGYGLYCGVAAVAAFFGKWRELPVPVGLVITFAVVLLFEYGPFTQRFDYEVAREIASSIPPEYSETVARLRRETPPDAVVLAQPRDALILLGTAGRKTVAIDRTFSNPYVPYEPRAAAAEQMFTSLANHDRDRFLETANKYGVSHVLLSDASPELAEACLTAPFVTRLFVQGHYSILQVAR